MIMKISISLIVLFIFLFSLLPAGAEDRPSLAIMDFKPMADVSPDLAEELAGYFISEIKALASFTLISRSRIDQKFTPRIDGYCDTPYSAVKRGEALRAELVIFAAVRKEGGKYIIESKLVRVPDAKVINTGSTAVSSTTRGLRAKGAELAAIDLVGSFAFIPARPAPTPVQLPPERMLTQPVIDRSKRPEPVIPPAEAFQPYLQYGLKGGLTIAGLYGGSSGSWDGRTGFGFGFLLRWWISDSFVIQPELLYNMKGAQYSEDYLGSPLKITMEMDYLELPILLKYYFPVDWELKPHIFAGPSLGFKINDDLKATYEGESVSIPDSVSDLKSYEAGLVFGFGLDYPLGPGEVNLDIRYSPSVTAVFNSGDEKNSIWSFTLGYVF